MKLQLCNWWKWWKRISEYNESFGDLLKEEKFQNVPIFVVFGNKADLEIYFGLDEIINNLNKNDITGRNWFLNSCSDLKGNASKDELKIFQ